MSDYKDFSNKQINNVINEDEFEEIINAISEGEYSWACVLMLETAGYNPLNHIPYRTYTRLIKKHCKSRTSSYKSQSRQMIQSNSNGRVNLQNSLIN